jgi:hypothetical protein
MSDEPHVSMSRYWLTRISEATTIPFDKRQDLAWMRQAVSLAHAYARAALIGREPPPPKVLPGQLDLFAPREQDAA